MKGYCSVENIEDYTLTEVDTNFEDTVEEWIGQMEDYIEKQTERVFIADSEASERWYNGSGTDELLLDEFIDITSLVVYDSLGNEEYILTKDTNYLTYPYNELPKRGVIVKYYNTLGFTEFPEGTKNIKATAKWGYSEEVPELIKFATMVLVSGIVNFSNQSEGEVASEKIGEYSITYRNEKQWEDYQRAKDIIDQFTKHNV
jgi:hypothetical protein